MIRRNARSKFLSPRIACIAVLAASPVLVTGCAQSSLTAKALLEPSKSTAVRTALTDDDRIQQAAAGGKPRPSSRATQTRQTETVEQALGEARKLRLANRKHAALRVLDEAAGRHPQNKTLTVKCGLLALETGRLKDARRLLDSAIKSGSTDWRLHSALGAALASAGEHQKAAQRFEKALRLSPGNPAVLNNLAMSYAMAGKLDRAEKLLRRVVSKGAKGHQLTQANQNLALVLGLAGKTREAQRIAASTMPRATAAANADYLRRLSKGVRISRATGSPAPRSERFAGLRGARPTSSD